MHANGLHKSDWGVEAHEYLLRALEFGACYDGIDVVMENKRQICIFKQANASAEPWFWWDFVQKFDTECSMTKSTYDEECSERAFLDVGGNKLGGGLATLTPRVVGYKIQSNLSNLRHIVNIFKICQTFNKFVKF